MTIFRHDQMLPHTWSTSSLHKPCNQDPLSVSSVAAGDGDDVDGGDDGDGDSDDDNSNNTIVTTIITIIIVLWLHHQVQDVQFISG